MKIKLQLKAERFLLGVLDEELGKKSHESLFLYVITARRLLNDQKWKHSAQPTMEGWEVKMKEPEGKPQLISLIRKYFIGICRGEKKE